LAADSSAMRCAPPFPRHEPGGDRLRATARASAANRAMPVRAAERSSPPTCCGPRTTRGRPGRSRRAPGEACTGSRSSAAHSTLVQASVTAVSDFGARAAPTGSRAAAPGPVLHPSASRASSNAAHSVVSVTRAIATAGAATRQLARSGTSRAARSSAAGAWRAENARSSARAEAALWT
jgi:hypothetical protein